MTVGKNTNIKFSFDGALAMQAMGMRALMANGAYGRVNENLEVIFLISSIFCPIESITHACRVVLHELSHATGDASRLARGLEKQPNELEMKTEECIAELSSNILMTRLGLHDDRTREMTAAYMVTFGDGVDMALVEAKALEAADYVQAHFLVGLELPQTQTQAA